MHGFELTEDVKEDFSGGTIQCGPGGQMFDIGQALQKSDGVIYTDDDLFAQVLASYPALKRVEGEVPSDASPVELPYASVTQTTVPEPWVPQTPDEVPQARVEFLSRGEGEVPAEHADDAQTPEEAQNQGEAVSTGTSSDEQAQGEQTQQESEQQLSRSRAASSSRSK